MLFKEKQTIHLYDRNMDKSFYLWKYKPISFSGKQKESNLFILVWV